LTCLKKREINICKAPPNLPEGEALGRLQLDKKLFYNYRENFTNTFNQGLQKSSLWEDLDGPLFKIQSMIHFDLPKEKSSIIKVIGVGGGGSNAVNHMFSQMIEGVNFIICNTDAQAIAQSMVPNRIQLGPHLTQGLGAGANPEIGRQATEESLEEIRRILEVNTKMAFITAGMGGGTGTGGAPIISKICKDLGILTVGIVTTPFAYEGKKRIQQAEEVPVPQVTVSTDTRRKNLTGFWDKFKDRLVDLFKEEEDHHL